MHILLLPSWYKTPGDPVRGGFFRDQAQALRKAGHQVGMLVPPSRLLTFHGLAEVRRHWRQRNTDISVEDDNGVMVYRIPWWGWRESLAPQKRGELALQIYNRYVREVGKPDVLHGHSILFGGYLAAYIGQRCGTPSVVTEHSSNFVNEFFLPGQVSLIQTATKQITRLLAVSLPLAQAMKKYGATSVGVLGNPVDVDFFTPAGHVPPETPFRFASIGTLRAIKRYDILFEAFANRFRGQPVQLAIAGDGRLRERLEQHVRALGLADQVTFLGRLARDEVRSLIQRSHVVVSASQTETFGITLIEAMACGKPVVATRSGGPETFVNEHNGLLVSVGDAGALAQAMQQMIDQYDRYDPAYIRAQCVEKFSEAAIIRKLEAIYAEVVQADGRQGSDT